MQYVGILHMNAHALVLLAFFPLASVHAQGCDNALTQLEMNQCAQKAYIQAENILEKDYRGLWQRTDAPQRRLLETAQQRWHEYRQADCEFQYYAARQGSIGLMSRILCLTDKTLERSREFKQLLHCPEGDIECALLPE